MRYFTVALCLLLGCAERELSPDEIETVLADMEREECESCKGRLKPSVSACRARCRVSTPSLRYSHAFSGGCACTRPRGDLVLLSWDNSHCDFLPPICQP